MGTHVAIVPALICASSVEIKNIPSQKMQKSQNGSKQKSCLVFETIAGVAVETVARAAMYTAVCLVFETIAGA